VDISPIRAIVGDWVRFCFVDEQHRHTEENKMNIYATGTVQGGIYAGQFYEIITDADLPGWYKCRIENKVVRDVRESHLETDAVEQRDKALKPMREYQKLHPAREGSAESLPKPKKARSIILPMVHRKARK
jgi:hypothetical protein